MYTMNWGEKAYLDLLVDILANGDESDNRTNVRTKKVFARMLWFDLSQGFPLLTTKKVWFKGVVRELLWMISGSTNIRTLVLQGVNIWNEWPLKHYLLEHGRFEQNDPKTNREGWDKEMEIFTQRIKENEEFAQKWGELGPVYGYQWRHWLTPDGRVIDQLQNAIQTLKTDPNSRRIIVLAWNPSDIEEMEVSGLPPCHYSYQFGVANGKLNMIMNQRSVDTFLGLPFNIASYALLTSLVAEICGFEPGVLALSLADTHIYLNHLQQVETQIGRNPFKPPALKLAHRDDIDDYVESDFEIDGYQHHGKLPGEIAI